MNSDIIVFYCSECKKIFYSKINTDSFDLLILNNITSNTNQYLTINGGYIYVDTAGDGLDSNGSIYINGGTTIVNGPTNDGNGALDYDSECVIKGGTLISAGSSGMLQSASTNSDNYTMTIVFDYLGLMTEK